LRSDAHSLWESITARAVPAGQLHGAGGRVALADLAHASVLGGRLAELRDATVVIAIKDQLTAALVLLELDGLVRRMVLCAPDLAPEHYAGVIERSQAEACVRDAASAAAVPLSLPVSLLAEPSLTPLPARPGPRHASEWILLTSGTTGAPKLVLHTLASLTSALAGQPPPAQPLVWSTFYDIRRYGGLQIFLRAVHAGSLLLSHADEPVLAFLERAASAGVTHISGTPSHWRKALMSGAVTRIAPRYVRLSGEIADQGVLDNLRGAFPQATVAHAFASTEAGVAFEVRDGRAGFPASFLGGDGPVELRVSDETLRVRSPGTARCYLGEAAESLRAADGFVDTGDRVEERDGRCYFVGRRGGVINVGGQKVHPEEVEAVINAHPWVRMSLVRARRNAITGAIVTADVVLAEEGGGRGERPAGDVLTRELAERCRQALAAHKVPAMIRIVPALEVSPSGKLVRPNA
jgi:acyl-coenzyme A synthetase/AMP-(fatty) acid ligase